MVHRFVFRPAALCLMVAGALLPSQRVSAAPAAASGGTQAVLAKECGACHMVFGPEFLPARSWVALMDGLTNHFGETATLDSATRQEIAGYLVTHAADAPDGNGHYIRGLRMSQTPLRITRAQSVAEPALTASASRSVALSSDASSDKSCSRRSGRD
jgi:hypothetical protein